MIRQFRLYLFRLCIVSLLAVSLTLNFSIPAVQGVLQPSPEETGSDENGHSLHEPVNLVYVAAQCTVRFSGILKTTLSESGRARGLIQGSLEGFFGTGPSNSTLFGDYVGAISGAFGSGSSFTGTTSGNLTGTLDNAPFTGSVRSASVTMTLRATNERNEFNSIGFIIGSCDGRYRTTSAVTGISDVTELRFGGSIAQDSRLVMKVKSKEPFYWRGNVYDFYTGRSWLRTDQSLLLKQETGTGNFTDQIQDPIPKKARLVETKFELIDVSSKILFAPYRPYKIETKGVPFTVDSYGTVRVSSSNADNTTSKFKAGFSYSVFSFVANATADDLRKASTDYPNEIRTRYLQIPHDLPARVRDLALNLTKGLDNPYDKAKAIERYLRETSDTKYSLRIADPPERQDAVDYFLFESKTGYSLYFGSVMVVLSRLAGIPARFVTVYAVGEYNPGIDAYEVRSKDAHGFAELYFNQYGWIGFEATPGGPARPDVAELAGANRLKLAGSQGSSSELLLTLVNVPRVAFRGESFEIPGKVLVLKTINGIPREVPPPENSKVSIFLNRVEFVTLGERVKMADASTSADGEFTAVSYIPKDDKVPPGNYQLITEVSSSDNPVQTRKAPSTIIGIKSRTNLAFEVSVNQKDTIATTQLFDDVEKPIVSREVQFYVDGVPSESIRGDANGVAEATFNLPAGLHNFTALFHGSSDYDATSTSKLITVGSLAVNSRDQVTLFSATAAVIGGSFAFVYKRIRAKQKIQRTDKWSTTPINWDEISLKATPREAIIKSYFLLRERIDDYNRHDARYLTHWEYLDAIHDKIPSIREQVKKITYLFDDAAYSSKEFSDEDKKKAVDAVRAVFESLRNR